MVAASPSFGLPILDLEWLLLVGGIEARTLLFALRLTHAADWIAMSFPRRSTPSAITLRQA